MITQSDLISASRTKSIPLNLIPNMNQYLIGINKFCNLCNFEIIHTSFYRSTSDQLEIYKNKARLKKHPFANGVFNPSCIPMKSQHLYCRAGDIADTNGQIKKWIMQNEFVLEKCGFWCEDFNITKTWVHFQCIPPKSGKRFFIP